MEELDPKNQSSNYPLTAAASRIQFRCALPTVLWLRHPVNLALLAKPCRAQLLGPYLQTFSVLKHAEEALREV